MKLKILQYSLLFLFLFTVQAYCAEPSCQHDTFSVSVNDRKLVFSDNGDLLSVSFDKPFLKQTSISGSESLPLVSYDPDVKLQDNNSKVLYTHAVTENKSSFIIRFTETIPLNDSSKFVIDKQYTVDKSSYMIEFIGSCSGTDHIQSQPCIISTIGSTYNDLRFVTVNRKNRKVTNLKSFSSDTLSAGFWKGNRSRFGAFIFKGDTAYSYLMNFTDHSVSLRNITSLSDSIKVSFYCGPVIYKDLLRAGPECTYLLFPLWFWMRWLSLGLMHLFDMLLSLSGNVILSIIALSVCVKIIISPLFLIADKWQQQVNRESSILGPRLAEIKSRYKGEEQTQKILALHKELGISPMYSLKSLGSAAIQIPVFFAAYHALSEHYSLCQVSFLWMKDLAVPDHAFILPFAIPLLGKYLNILPFVMTSITFASSWVHHDASLSAELRKSQRNNLYFMALLFFVLLYTSPAGMVIYWTMNNFLALLSSIYHKVMLLRHTQAAHKPISQEKSSTSTVNPDIN